MKRFVMTTIALLALVMLTVGCDREVTGDVQVVNNADENCFVCHNGYLDQAQGEWANSVHAAGAYIDYTNRGGSDCTRCHDQEGFISFLETGQLPDVPFDMVSAIGCFTCHNPHESGDLSLRTSAPYTLENGVVFDHEAGNLCAACHHSRLDASTITDNFSVNSHWGPHHGPQADMLEGTNGYEFPGGGYSFSSSPHKSVVRDACAGCHMGNVENHDGYKVGGHTFRIFSEDGVESQIEFCIECHSAAEEIDFLADEDYDHDGTIEGYQTEVDGLLDSLEVLLIAEGALNASGGQYTTTIADGDVAGALYNWVFISKEDKSHGVHNFNYTIDLLDASLDYMSGLKRSPGLATVPSH